MPLTLLDAKVKSERTHEMLLLCIKEYIVEYQIDITTWKEDNLVLGWLQEFKFDFITYHSFE